MKTMVCECSRTLYYKQRYHCYECICGNCYNANGQALAPLEQWRDEYDDDYYDDY